MHCIKFVGKVLNQDITNNNMRVLFLSLVSLITTFVNTIYLNYIAAVMSINYRIKI